MVDNNNSLNIEKLGRQAKVAAVKLKENFKSDTCIPNEEGAIR